MHKEVRSLNINVSMVVTSESPRNSRRFWGMETVLLLLSTSLDCWIADYHQHDFNLALR
jgi:hypothetical protein